MRLRLFSFRPQTHEAELATLRRSFREQADRISRHYNEQVNELLRSASLMQSGSHHNTPASSVMATPARQYSAATHTDRYTDNASLSSRSQIYTQPPASPGSVRSALRVRHSSPGSVLSRSTSVMSLRSKTVQISEPGSVLRESQLQAPSAAPAVAVTRSAVSV